MARLWILTLLFILCSASLWGQIFPDEEYLYLITTVDDSVLRGRVTDDTDGIEEFMVDAARRQQGMDPLLPPGSTLTLEIYGGSQFVIAAENIVLITRRRNPDFGKTPRVLPIAEMLARGDASFIGTDAPVPTDETADTVSRGIMSDATRAYLGQGTMFGLAGGIGRPDPRGSDWDLILEDLDASKLYGIKQGVEAFAVHLRPLVGLGSLQTSWGFRGAAGFYETYTGFEAGVDTGEGSWDLQQRITAVHLPIEVIASLGGGRLLWYLGAGVELAIPTSTGDEQWGSDETLYDFPRHRGAPIPSIIGSTGALVRISRNWSAETRIYFQRDLASWYSDFEQYILIVPGITAGIAYHPKER